MFHNMTKDIITNLPQIQSEISKETSVKDIRFLQDKREFLEDVKLEIENKQSELKIELSKKEHKDFDLIKINNFFINSYKELLKFKIKDIEDLEYAEWLYNFGDLRTEKEINEMNEMLRIKRVKQSSEYNNGYNPFLVFTISFIVNFAFLIATGIIFICHYLLYTPLFILPALITSCYTQHHAEKFKVPSDNTIIKCVAASAIAVGIATYISNKRECNKPLTQKEV